MDYGDLRRVYEWEAVLESATYYELLGILEIADEAAIREAFRGFAQAFHPDQHPNCDDETADALRRIFQRGTEAYRVLSRPTLRTEYDLSLARGQLRLPSLLPESVRAPTLPGAAKSLEDLCRSPGARRFARRAEQLISESDLVGAKRELQLALREDGPNADLTERLDALDLALYAEGR